MFVMVMDPTMRQHFREVHHHPRGVCELPHFLRAYRQGRWVRTACYLEWDSRVNLCSCRHCGDQPGRRRRQRAERAAARRLARSVQALHRGGSMD
jgi:hypothetical protein